MREDLHIDTRLVHKRDSALAQIKDTWRAAGFRIIGKHASFLHCLQHQRIRIVGLSGGVVYFPKSVVLLKRNNLHWTISGVDHRNSSSDRFKVANQKSAGLPLRWISPV